MGLEFIRRFQVPAAGVASEDGKIPSAKSVLWVSFGEAAFLRLFVGDDRGRLWTSPEVFSAAFLADDAQLRCEALCDTAELSHWGSTLWCLGNPERAAWPSVSALSAEPLALSLLWQAPLASEGKNSALAGSDECLPALTSLAYARDSPPPGGGSGRVWFCLFVGDDSGRVWRLRLAEGGGVFEEKAETHEEAVRLCVSVEAEDCLLDSALESGLRGAASSSANLPLRPSEALGGVRDLQVANVDSQSARLLVVSAEHRNAVVVCPAARDPSAETRFYLVGSRANSGSYFAVASSLSPALRSRLGIEEGGSCGTRPLAVCATRPGGRLWIASETGVVAATLKLKRTAVEEERALERRRQISDEASAACAEKLNLQRLLPLGPDLVLCWQEAPSASASSEGASFSSSALFLADLRESAVIAEWPPPEGSLCRVAFDERLSQCLLVSSSGGLAGLKGRASQFSLSTLWIECREGAPSLSLSLVPLLEALCKDAARGLALSAATFSSSASCVDTQDSSVAENDTAEKEVAEWWGCWISAASHLCFEEAVTTLAMALPTTATATSSLATSAAVSSSGSRETLWRQAATVLSDQLTLREAALRLRSLLLSADRKTEKQAQAPAPPCAFCRSRLGSVLLKFCKASALLEAEVAVALLPKTLPLRKFPQAAPSSSLPSASAAGDARRVAGGLAAARVSSSVISHPVEDGALKAAESKEAWSAVFRGGKRRQSLRRALALSAAVESAAFLWLQGDASRGRSRNCCETRRLSAQMRVLERKLALKKKGKGRFQEQSAARDGGELRPPSGWVAFDSEALRLALAARASETATLAAAERKAAAKKKAESVVRKEAEERASSSLLSLQGTRKGAAEAAKEAASAMASAARVGLESLTERVLQTDIQVCIDGNGAAADLSAAEEFRYPETAVAPGVTVRSLTEEASPGVFLGEEWQASGTLAGRGLFGLASSDGLRCAAS